MRVIKLMADYQCFPLWEASPGKVGNIDPSSLPISEELGGDLLKWADLYDATLNTDDPIRSGFKTAAERLEFAKIGTRLCQRLREELGPEFQVVIAI
jgi:hypothetical protein